MIHRFALALLVGSIGGIVFESLDFPLPWMLGPMSFCMVANLCGLRLANARRVQRPVMMVIGVMLGATFTPEIITRLPGWLPMLTGLIALCLISGAINIYYYWRIEGMGWPTAFFSGMPGGLVEMIELGHEAGGDPRKIALAHSSRIFIVVMGLPLLLTFLTGVVPTGSPPDAISVLDVEPQAYVWLIGCALVGGGLGQLLRLPGFAMIGPMLVSGMVHATGLSDFTIPWEVVVVAQVILGTTLGTSFAGMPATKILSSLAYSIGSVGILLSATFTFAFLVAYLSGYPAHTLVLAFSPGGFAEMSIVALSLGFDVTLVAAHHVVRIMSMIVLAPVIYRLFGGTFQGQTGAALPSTSSSIIEAEAPEREREYPP